MRGLRNSLVDGLMMPNKKSCFSAASRGKQIIDYCLMIFMDFTSDPEVSFTIYAPETRPDKLILEDGLFCVSTCWPNKL